MTHWLHIVAACSAWFCTISTDAYALPGLYQLPAHTNTQSVGYYWMHNVSGTCQCQHSTAAIDLNCTYCCAWLNTCTYTACCALPDVSQFAAHTNTLPVGNFWHWLHHVSCNGQCQHPATAIGFNCLYPGSCIPGSQDYTRR